MAKAKPKPKKAKTKPAVAAVCNLILPVKEDHLLMLAKKLVAGEKITVGEVNGGRYTAAETEALWGYPVDENGKRTDDDSKIAGYSKGSSNDARYNGKFGKQVPASPAIYQPVLLEAARQLGMTFAGHCQPKKGAKQPSNWGGGLQKWKPEFGIESRFGRIEHLKDVRRCVTDERFLVTVGNSQYVIGDDKSNAIDVFHASKGESTYAYNLRCLKRLAFRGREKDIASVVFQINSGITTVAWHGDGTAGARLVVLPNTVATIGRLTRGGRNMTYAQIAKACGEKGDTKGIRFQAIDPIVGNKVTFVALVAAVKKAMSAKATITEDSKGKTAWERFVKKAGGKTDIAEARIAYNATVQTRNNPAVTHCLGLRNSVIHQALSLTFGDERSDKRITCLIGQRGGDEFTTAAKEALFAAEKADADAAPKADKPKADKPKADKPKPAAKKKRPKREATKKVADLKVVAPDPEPVAVVDTPAPVEVTDTSDDDSLTDAQSDAAETEANLAAAAAASED